MYRCVHAPRRMCHDMPEEIRGQPLLSLSTWVTGIELRLSSLAVGCLHPLSLVFVTVGLFGFCCCFEIGSYMTQTGLKLAMQPRMILSFWSSSLHLWEAKIQAYITMLGLHGAEDQFQGSMHARQALWAISPAPDRPFFSTGQDLKWK